MLWRQKLWGLTALLGACLRCTNSSTVDGGILDAGSDVADAKVDAGIDTGVLSGCDGGIVSDWAGWRRVPELDPCCPVDVPIDVQATVPAFLWKPCQTGRPNCEQVDNIKYRADNGGILYGGRGARGGDMLRLALEPGGYGESRIYDRQSGKAVAAWRMDDSRACGIALAFGESTVALLGFVPTPTTLKMFVASGAVQAVAFAPAFNYITEGGQIDVPEAMSASDAVVLFDEQTRGRFVRVKAGTASYAMTTPPPQLVNPYVHGAAAFGRDQRGNAGWSQYWRINSNGTLTLFRAKAQTHITALTSDKDTLYWAESWGGANIDPNDQPHVEIWTAPFTDDPATLAATAKLLVKLDGQMRRPGEMMAQDGFVGLSENNTAFIIRKQDGVLKTVPPFNGDAVGFPLFVSQTELWAIVHLPNDPGNVVSKIGLGVW